MCVCGDSAERCLHQLCFWANTSKFIVQNKKKCGLIKTRFFWLFIEFQLLFLFLSFTKFVFFGQFVVKFAIEFIDSHLLSPLKFVDRSPSNSTCGVLIA